MKLNEVVRYKRTQPTEKIPIFLREMELLSLAFKKRILTSFLDIDSEAEAEYAAALERLSPGYGPDSDPADLMERAYFAGVDLHMTLCSMRQSVVNLMIVGLYHLAEQQAKRLTGEPPAHLKKKPPLEVCHLLFRKDHTSSFPPLLTELRHLTNVAKHGSGHSLNRLRKLKPSLFREEMLGAFIPAQPTPLTGEGLYASAVDFDRYYAALAAFWNGLQ